ncbi:MAG: putative rRNA maturation factor [Saprospiraceae bacterium]|jgi:probable rRNA maturation factor
MTESIAVFSEDIEYQYPYEEKLAFWVFQTIEEEAKELASLNVIFCSDEFLLKINQEHLNHDYYTDIITFDYNTEEIEGELYISIERVRENAISLGVSFEHELHRVIIHGVLHLCGYGDKTDEEEKTMRSKEDFYLEGCSWLS